MADWQRCVTALATKLREEFGIAHVTLQPEPSHASPDPWRHCSLDAPDDEAVCITSARAPRRAAHAGHRH